MSEIDKERFCSNSDCKFHNHYVSVGSKYLEYVDPDQFGEIVLVREFSSAYTEKLYRVTSIKRDWIYKNGRPLGQFCTDCARDLLGLPKSHKGGDK